MGKSGDRNVRRLWRAQAVGGEKTAAYASLLTDEARDPRDAVSVVGVRYNSWCKATACWRTFTARPTLMNGTFITA